jgi:hypothetical protein
MEENYNLKVKVEKFRCSEEFCVMGLNGVWSDKSEPTFRRNILPPFSGAKSKPNKNSERSRRQAESYLISFLLSLVIAVVVAVING